MSTVLIVDDNEDTIRGTRSRFEYEGFKVDYAKNLKDAKKLLKSKNYVFIVMDVRFNDDDIEDRQGVEAVKSLLEGKLGAQNKETPIALMTNQPRSIQDTDLKKSANFFGTFGKNSYMSFFGKFEREFV